MTSPEPSPNTEHRTASAFHSLLRAQVRHEFTASQQYLAIAVWFRRRYLPQLATRFFAQAAEERGHALMMVQYLVDNDLFIQIPGVDEVSTAFEEASEPVELALEQELRITEQVTALARSAREGSDYIGEQFCQWFIKEQVERAASMRTLFNIVQRAGTELFDVEDFVAREMKSTMTSNTHAPAQFGSE